MRPLLISWLACGAAACALPVGDDPLELARVDAPITARDAGAYAPSLVSCDAGREHVQPGRPSCPECRVYPREDGTFEVQFPATMAVPVYLGAPQSGGSSVQVWTGESAAQAGLVTKVVRYEVEQLRAKSRLPAPVPPAPPVLYVEGPGCYTVISVDDGVWPSPYREPDAPSD